LFVLLGFLIHSIFSFGEYFSDICVTHKFATKLLNLIHTRFAYKKETFSGVQFILVVGASS
jgi:hypothetical protein